MATGQLNAGSGTPAATMASMAEKCVNCRPKNGALMMPATTDITASTMSGTVMGHGDSCG